MSKKQPSNWTGGYLIKTKDHGWQEIDLEVYETLKSSYPSFVQVIANG